MDENAIHYRDLVTPDDSIEKLISQLETAIEKYDTMKKAVQAGAVDMAKGLQNVSGATAEQQKIIQQTASEAEKMAETYEKTTTEMRKAERETLALKQAQKEKAQVDKLLVQMANSQNGSYNKLSAQYRLNKIRLNQMSDEVRNGTKAGQQLEAETKAIYEKMNQMQKATGKFTLQVGNYSIAAETAREAQKQMTEALLQMEQAGQKDTAEYQAMLKAAGDLKDQILDTQAAIKQMASDTGALDGVLSAMTLGSGSFGAVTGAMQLFGVESENVDEAQKKLQATIAVTQGLTAIQNTLQKQSALMLNIAKIQTLALTKAEQLDTKAKSKNIVVSKAATIAQKAFNAVAKANPYVLLAMAIVTVVGALALFAGGAAKAAKEQQKQNEHTLKAIEYTEQLSQKSEIRYKKEIQNAQNAVAMAQAQNKSKAEILELQKNELDKETELQTYRNKYNKNYIEQLDTRKKKLAEESSLLAEMEMFKTRGSNKKLEREIELQQSKVDLLTKQVEIGDALIEQTNDLEQRRATLAEQERQLAIETYKSETDTFRKVQDQKFSLIKNEYDRERAQTRAQYDRERADLEFELQTNVNLSAQAQDNIRQQIENSKLIEAQAIEKINRAEQDANLATARETEDLRLALLGDTDAAKRAQLLASYQRERADLLNQLKYSAELTKTQQSELTKQLDLLYKQYLKDKTDLENEQLAESLQRQNEVLQMELDANLDETNLGESKRLAILENNRQIELIKNKQLATDKRIDETIINAKYDAELLRVQDETAKQRAEMSLDQAQKLESSRFALTEKSERDKTIFALNQEKEKLQQILDLNETANVKLQADAVETVQNQIKAIENEIQKAKTPNDLYDVLGLNLTNAEKEGLNESLQYAKDALNEFMEARTAAADKAVENSEKEVESAQKALDAERQARANGYANDVQMAEKELALAKRNQDKALKQQADAQKAQQQIQTVEQAVNLVTATSKIFASMPLYLAIPAVAVMWGSFIASKVKAKQLTKEKYANGTVELLEGGSHASGHDISLGTTKDGKERRAEGGEFFAVINKRNSKKYRSLVPELINSLNNGTFEQNFARTNSADGVNVSVNPFGENLEKNVAEINERNQKQITFTNGKQIIRYKNVTRTILN